MKNLIISFLAVFLLATSCKDDSNATNLPALTTKPVSAITATSATLGGNITDAGAPAYTERGVCYATTENPTVENQKTTVSGTGTGEFNAKLIGLSPNTLYYARAYAGNKSGMAYGNEVSFMTNTDTGSVDDPDDPNKILNDELSYTAEKSMFKLWAPTAEDAVLTLYSAGAGGAALQTVSMAQIAGGYWYCQVSGDQKGKFYTFKIKYNGKYLRETQGIWAKAVGVNGNRAAIIDMTETNPAGWETDQRPPLANFTDIIIYEMHHRDFSINPNSGMKNKGKFLALTETGTKSPDGLSTGIDHLKELGITHVQILPSFDFDWIDETKLDQNKYDWGYAPKNYNVPEGSYSTDPYTPAVRIKEFKQMVQALHKNGIRVIMDVVYNHTSMSSANLTKVPLKEDGSCFELTYPSYFYRYNPDGSLSDGSQVGNDLADEKEEVSNYIVESCKYWVNEYHVDGFRFDLGGIHTIKTMNKVRSELNKIDPSIFLLNEAWDRSATALPAAQRSIKTNGLQFPGVAVFSDDIRNAIKGSDVTTPGFVQGTSAAGRINNLKFGICGATQNISNAPYANNPEEVINYVTCHDGRCLYDWIVASAPGTTADEQMRMNFLAQTIAFTSQGVPLFFAGEELYRTKGGIGDTNNQGDAINQISWANKKTYSRVFEYYKNLIALRKAHPAFRMTATQDVVANLAFLTGGSNLQLAFTLNGAAAGDSWKNIIVAFNGSRSAAAITIPAGDWTVVCDDAAIDLNSTKTVTGGSISLKPVSAFIAYKNN